MGPGFYTGVRDSRFDEGGRRRGGRQVEGGRIVYVVQYLTPGEHQGLT
jgi:hypothetical protein